MEFIEKLPRIFCTVDTLNELIQKAQDSMSGENKKHYDDLACAIEIVDLPYSIVWTPATDDTDEILSDAGYPENCGSSALMLMFHRFEDGTDTEDIQAMVVAVDENGSRRCSGSNMCKNSLIRSNVSAFYLAANGINRFLQDEELYEAYIHLEPIKEGMLLDIVNGQFVTKVVSGKDRPDMECFVNKGMFGMACKTRRPYKDEENVYDDEEEEIEEDNEEFQLAGDTLIRYNGCDTTVVIPDGIAQIGDGNSVTFFQSGVVNVSVPDSVKSIGAYAFYSCSTLENINIPDGVTEIGDHAFRQCSRLSAIAIPDDVEVIERECFWGCVGIEEIKLPKNLKIIKEKAFSGCISVPILTIPEGTQVIEDGAFWGDECLKKMTIPASVTEIGEMAFSDCDNLTIYTPAGSAAEEYAKGHDIPVQNI